MEGVVAPTEYFDDLAPVEETVEQLVAKRKAQSKGKTCFFLKKQNQLNNL